MYAESDMFWGQDRDCSNLLVGAGEDLSLLTLFSANTKVKGPRLFRDAFSELPVTLPSGHKKSFRLQQRVNCCISDASNTEAPATYSSGYILHPSQLLPM